LDQNRAQLESKLLDVEEAGVCGMKTCWVILMMSCVAITAGCFSRALKMDVEKINGRLAFTELTNFIALGPRVAGTAGAERAANYLAGRLHELGCPHVEIDSFGDHTPSGIRPFRNVIARWPGRGEEIIIIGSHYDTKADIDEGFQGANDSGSSTALLLHLASQLGASGKRFPAAGIWLVFFDGEECVQAYGPRDGLHGSRRMVERLRREKALERVRAMVLLDMVGDRDLSITIPRNVSTYLASELLQAAHVEGVRQKFGLYPFEIGDDHEPFRQAGVPALNIIDFLYGTVPGRNDIWHTPFDRMEHVSAESLQIVGRVTARLINRLLDDTAAGRPRQ
jgi:glutaminyl-peptide cyclotransferase